MGVGISRGISSETIIILIGMKGLGGEGMIVGGGEGGVGGREVGREVDSEGNGGRGCLMMDLMKKKSCIE